jgi:proteic killer suppression protein
MIVTFEKGYLQELYETGKTSDKKHRYPPDVTERYKYCIDILIRTSRIERLYTVNSLHYEVLKGNKQGISSIRVTKKYRIEFTVTHGTVDPVVTVCNIIELSNHYK